jgi:hypothetical protein
MLGWPLLLRRSLLLLMSEAAAAAEAAAEINELYPQHVCGKKQHHWNTEMHCTDVTPFITLKVKPEIRSVVPVFPCPRNFGMLVLREARN